MCKRHQQADKTPTAQYRYQAYTIRYGTRMDAKLSVFGKRRCDAAECYILALHTIVLLRFGYRSDASGEPRNACLNIF